MKLKFDIECTPEEARTFLGLPDVVPMQERLMKELEKRLQDNMQNLSPEEMVKTWMPASMAGMAEMQKMFWGQLGMTTPNQKPKSSDD